MALEVGPIGDLIGGGGIIGGIVAAVTTFGWWMRKERSEKARTNADISASNASISASDSQAKQIEALTKRVNELSEAIIRSANDIDKLRGQLAKHKASVIGIDTLLPLIHLCTECTTRYQPILNEIAELVASVSTTVLVDKDV